MSSLVFNLVIYLLLRIRESVNNLDELVIVRRICV